MKKGLSIIILLLLSFLLGAQNVLIQLNNESSIVLYDDAMTSSVSQVVQSNSKEDVYLGMIIQDCGDRFLIDLYSPSDNYDVLLAQGYINKCYCYGYVYPDTYLEDREGNPQEYVKVYSTPYMDDCIIVPLNRIDIKGIALGHEPPLNRTVFSIDGKTYYGYVLRFCTNPYTTCN